MRPLPILPAARALLACTLLAGVGAPAVAQVYAPPPPPYYPAPDYPPQYPGQYPERGYGAEEDIVVYGRHRRVPRDVEALSQRVSYADLDLYYPEDRRELRRRVSETARYLCDRLGEDDTGGSVVPSCRDAATRDALRRVGL